MRRRFHWLAGAALAVAAVFGSSGAVSAAGHGPITITSDSGFQSCACVTSGNGTATSPYVIGPWAITSANSSGAAIEVDNSGGGVTKYFTITGISANYNDPAPTDPLLLIKGVTLATSITNVSANNDGTGLELDSSSNITLDNLQFNKMNGLGAIFNGDTNVSLSNSKLKATSDGEKPHLEDGLWIENSHHVNIGGVAACPKSQTCNTFDYDSGWGIYVQDSSFVKISHASNNADDTGGYVLDDSSNVDLGFSNAEGGGPICITVNGAKESTGYFTDLQGGLLLINGSSNNTIHDSSFAANVPVSIGSGGNGVFADPCSNSFVPFSNAEGPMGAGNTFTNVCFSNTDIASLPPNPWR